MEHAYEIAVEALCLALTCREKRGQPIQVSSNPAKILSEAGLYLVMIEFDMLTYKKYTSSRSVKKILSIPEWLNKAAMDMELGSLR